MRWLPLLLIFFFTYIEVSIFIRVAEVFGVAMTLLLVVFTSCVGVSLVRNQGMRTFLQMQQKLEAGESPAVEMVKSVSLVLAGFLLLLPGFFTDFLGLMLLLPPVQKHLTLKLMPHLYIWRARSGTGTGTGTSGSEGNTFEGEYQRKDKEHNDRIEPRDNDRDNH
ncbi:FxsA family protein [Pectobacteriaceae bacterium CE70]|uniref:Membrane protein FxsA n=1 Tax=Serratia sp. (strain ATCC 39006) TaxID=104623 RepID=A0A2I5TPX2_SERS3|nr:FxsA family protein [Serratia sp. ATCC 39006]WJV63099.1 FxsA family protein [Pectobacteriaceae bacterium C52]WJV67425.1 FxsA family protein [Pectobacteriaceae bacterium CE70]WJY11407.1 FxsA family protein [Pectobacteriaceae bacterium C80]AUH02295.1 membrane protein FxsA [Serratia sp. ATCC 39006]AUH06617.1 membrane protein FxsA [Serratia sp. ATCC 39006]